MRSLAHVLTILLVATGLLALDGAPSSAAAPAPAAFVTMFSEQHEFVGGHQARSFRNGPDQITIDGSVRDIVYVRIRERSGVQWTLAFAPAPGQKLEAGAYLDAERTEFRTDGHPGISVSGDGNGCNEVSGRFRVLDVAPDLSRLWMVYESHCEQEPGALFGEIRYGMPVADPRVSVDGGEIVWPDEYVGWAGRPAEVRVTATSSVPVAIGTAAVSGSGFTLLGNTCPRTLAPGKQCTLTVGFAPGSIGTRYGALTVVANGRTRQVNLEGTGFLPRSAWLSQGDQGEQLGDAFVELSPDANRRPTSSADGWGSSSVMGMVANNYVADAYFTATFQAPSGQQLLPGTTFTDVMKYPSTSASVAGMEVAAWDKTCDTVTGSFTIRAATFDGPQMTSFIIDFVQHCNGAAAAYRGSLYWKTDGRPPVTRPTFAITAAPQRVTAGTPTSLAGTLRNGSIPVPAARVYLYSRVVGAVDWHHRGATTTNADGRYAFTLTQARNVDLLVQYFGSLGTAPSRTLPRRVSVRPKLTLAANRKAATVGSKVRLRARITPARPGHVVVLQRYTRGAWRTVQRLKQPRSGPTVFVVRSTRKGRYIYRVRTPADATLLGATSAVATIRVG